MPNTYHHKQSVKSSGSEHLEATRENGPATHRYNELDPPPIRSTRASVREHSTASLLDQYRELLRHQMRHGTLVALRDELARMKFSSGRTAVDLRTNITHELPTQTQTHPLPHQLETLTVSINRAIQDLELAVVQAHREAKREKAVLERAKASTLDMNQRTPDCRRHAISAVRRELTTWLEQSLDKCQESHNHVAVELDGGVESEDNDVAEPWEAKIDGQYERYLEARRHLIDIVACLRTPLPTPTPPQERKAKGIVSVSATQALEKSTAQQVPHTLAAETGVGAENALETRLLPSMQQHNTAHAHLTSLDEQLGKETTATINMLDRLGEESQLLQAFPLLAHSGRFEHAASAFGNVKKQDRDTSTSDTEGQDMQDTISKRLKPWLFAAQAADVASMSSVDAYLQKGDQAVHAASRSLDALRVVREAGI
ncbi:hypothetical protein A1O7_10071 [Cladophialophora yegresii CBS 114405]|uniref:Uncharacterized protein n=1 Tax=Cladophialophora yegresii CBS 114405 TaxID=1182544 RepID=W9VNY5_9EURO|nr:uncharacterized protein A1O7_10071 [Cladophialophora yegresii CBS 114405]EXJ54730.1 hypothetical protein A1O7_10071 [Cladophialophora yegresii CBS 114405]